MQCSLCHCFVYNPDSTCHHCWSPLRLGENVCRTCGTPVHCEVCGGDWQRSEMFNARPTREQAPTLRLETYRPPTLEYEYQTVPISFRLSRGEDESTQHFNQRFHQVLVERTLSAALDGWQTVDPLEYPILDRLGLIDHSWKAMLGWQTVKLRLKRIIGERRAR